MGITMEEFNRILSAPSENELLEFKEAREQFDFEKLCEYCVAIGNEGDGKLILGVTNKRVGNEFANTSLLSCQESSSLKCSEYVRP
jgi:ATP-dependent DNA helicase RecG